ncbi:FecCD family ABC transporter permease [Chitinimonas lacunae]|uniref:FecCD family ABC transporter permease n=1 Tax=Chitinimonas lacunae TaxID=1963018 RepID=A0ABV8MUW1_9NEIS
MTFFPAVLRRPRLPLPASAAPPLWRGGLLLLLILALLSAASGAVSIPPWRIPALLLGDGGNSDDSLWRTLLLEVRLPRIILALWCGAALAMAGGALQALFRNPLAEPGLIGSSSGAALAAAATLALGGSVLAQAPAAFVGALAATWLAWRIGRGRDNAGLLLAGVAINSLAGAGLALLAYLANDIALRGATFWAMGSLAAASWHRLAWLSPALALVGWLLWRQRSALDALLLGEREAFHLGFDVSALRRRLLVLSALTVALTVAACGALAFIGLVAPHLARRLLGAQHGRLLPTAALLGAALLLAADWLARLVMAPAELPLGVVLSCVGAPFFLFLLWRGARPSC